MLKRMKKGFTLAELLIVVAIIAVLTAIAVPIFVTTLGSAKDASTSASINAVRSAGIARIISIDTTKKDREEYKAVYDENGNMYQYIVVTADIDARGNISNVKLVKYDAGTYTKDKVNIIEGEKATVLVTSLDFGTATVD